MSDQSEVTPASMRRLPETLAPGRKHDYSARIILAILLLGLLAVGAWVFSQRRRDHWDEVARAQYYLDRDQPDLAFQAVSGVRDEAPGAPEALTLAARALMTRGVISPARYA